MDEARVVADELSEVGQERDDVVLGDALDGVDLVDVKLGFRALLPNGLCRVPGDHADFGHASGGVRLDLEPDPETCLRRPDRHHLRA